MIPREHGAWVMLYVPFLMGVLVAPEPFPYSIPALLFVTGGYCARAPISVLFSRRRQRHGEATRWLAGFAAMAGIGAVGLLSHSAVRTMSAVVVVGAVSFVVNLWLATRREHRGFVGELVGIAGLVLTAPLGYLAANGPDSTMLVELWLLNLLYFGSSIVYVKWRVANLTSSGDGNASRRALAGLATYHGVGAACLGCLIVSGFVPPPVAWAYVPLALRYGLGRVVSVNPTLTQVGVSEVIFAVLYLAAASWGLRA